MSAPEASIGLLRANIERVIIGKRAVVELAIAALLARGHLLIEDVPGLGKTMLARALARSIALDSKRIQFTPDLLPSDVTGVPVYDQKSGEFVFRPGPVFTNILLADEINRATPRTQSALLECMEEFQVSADGKTYELSPVFMVIATQNPIELAGTYPLPEAQLDRFLMRTAIGYALPAEEIRVLDAQLLQHPIHALRPVMSSEDVQALQARVGSIHIDPSVKRYMMDIIEATRRHAELKLGASPRGLLALARGSQAMALIQGKDFVEPATVKTMATYVLPHRLIVDPQTAVSGKSTMTILDGILSSIKPPVL